MEYQYNVQQMTEAANALQSFYDAYNEQNENSDAGMSFFIWLYDYLFTNKKSMYLERVHIDNFTMTKDKDEQNQNYIRYSFLMNVCTEKNILLENLEVSLSFENEWNKTHSEELLKETIQATIQTALNGYLTSPDEKENLFRLFAILTDSEMKEFHYSCDECNEEFSKAEYLLTHLKETGHKDSIWKQYGWFEPKYR